MSESRVDNMAAARLNAALDALHWGGVALAAQTGVNDRTARRWISGQNPPPVAILTWVERLAAFHRENPAPVTPTKPPTILS